MSLLRSKASGLRSAALCGLVVVLAASGCLYDLSQDTGTDSGACPPDIRCGTCRDVRLCADTGKPCAGCREAGACPDIKPCKTCPDAAAPDAKVKPDAPVIKSLVDDTFNDFKQGTLSESGAKIYVSAQGNVQLLDRLDVNGDGWLDLVFSNHYDDTTFFINSYIYWGAPTGFSPTNRKELPTMGALSSVVADFNDDGHADLFFANYKAGSTYVTNSYIYWGAKTGFSTTNRSLLPTNGAISGQAADLNRDGYLDLVVVNHYDGSWKTDSYIYWGSAAGFSAVMKIPLPTMGGHGLSIADLDRDGRLDLVISNAYTKAHGNPNSYIYWGSSPAYSKSNRLELPTWGPFGNTVAALRLTGAQLETLLRVGTGDVHGITQVSGLRVVLDHEKQGCPGEDVLVSVTLDDGEPLKADGQYLVATNGYLAQGGGGFSVVTGGLPANAVEVYGDRVVRDAVAKYLASLGNVDSSERLLVDPAHPRIEVRNADGPQRCGQR